MITGLLTLQIHLPYARSLKDKRQALRSLKDRLRTHLNVAVAEVDHQDLWQRSTLGVVSVSAEQSQVRKVLEHAIEEAERALEEGMVESTIEMF